MQFRIKVSQGYRYIKGYKTKKECKKNIRKEVFGRNKHWRKTEIKDNEINKKYQTQELVSSCFSDLLWKGYW